MQARREEARGAAARMELKKERPRMSYVQTLLRSVQVSCSTRGFRRYGSMKFSALVRDPPAHHADRQSCFSHFLNIICYTSPAIPEDLQSI